MVAKLFIDSVYREQNVFHFVSFRYAIFTTLNSATPLRHAQKIFHPQLASVGRNHLSASRSSPTLLQDHLTRTHTKTVKAPYISKLPSQARRSGWIRQLRHSSSLPLQPPFFALLRLLPTGAVFFCFVCISISFIVPPKHVRHCFFLCHILAIAILSSIP